MNKTLYSYRQIRVRLGWFLSLTGAIIVLTSSTIPSTVAPQVESYDVVIVGGSSGGIGAAIGAARSGVSVVLIEDTPALGGMISNGISNADCFSYESLSGVFDEFRYAVKAHYLADKAEMETPLFKYRKKSNHIDGRAVQSNEAAAGGRWEPHVADEIFKKMAASYPNLKIYYRRFATGVLKEQNRVTGVTTDTDDKQPITFLGKTIIDATHEADIAAWAGAPYRVGREPRSPLEPHAGEIYYFNDSGEILPGTTGRQDAGIVSSGVRLCVKFFKPEEGTAHLLTTPPPGYDPAKYEHSHYGSGKNPSVPKQKSEMNVNPIGNELQEANWPWPDANRQERQRLYEVYKNHALGFLYYLQTVRGEKHLGLAPDEFRDNGNVPYRVFIREARRIEGEVTMTEADINPFILGNSFVPPFQPTSIAIGHYPMDSKPVHPKTDVSKPDKGEGDFFLANAMTAFQVPYGAIVPKNIDGLLVPVALSATHVAFSSIRMDPTWVVLGQAAGVAASISAQTGVPVRQVSVPQIQEELLKQKCKLVFYWDVQSDHPHFDVIQKASLKGWISGSDTRDFRPDSLLTRAEAASLLTRALQLWPSVSNSHFTDVPFSHPAFRDVETLFDRGALKVLGVEPRWPQAGGYNAQKHMGFGQRSNFGAFRPNAPISATEFQQLIQVLRSGNPTFLPPGELVASASNALPPAPESLTRAAAVNYVDQILNPKPKMETPAPTPISKPKGKRK
ncbi:FAD-dependent oxidoreductase [Larkinella punicea]|nr:FAD-dependent oxidoreductase [Larkinella punicea]